MYFENSGIEYRQEHQDDERSHGQTCHDAHSHRTVHWVADKRCHAEDGGQRCHDHRTGAAHGGTDNSLVGRKLYLIAQAVDFIDQHNAVLNHHTNQAHSTKDGDKGEGLPGKKQCGCDTTEDEGHAGEYDAYGAPVVKEQQQDDDDEDKDSGIDIEFK